MLDTVGRSVTGLAFWVCCATVIPTARAADGPTLDQAAAEYTNTARPLVTKYCLECHATDVMEGELDLERFGALGDVRKATDVWLKVAEMLDNGEMPPKERAGCPPGTQSPPRLAHPLPQGRGPRQRGGSGARRAPAAQQRPVHIHPPRSDRRPARPGPRVPRRWRRGRRVHRTPATPWSCRPGLAHEVLRRRQRGRRPRRRRSPTACGSRPGPPAATGPTRPWNASAPSIPSSPTRAATSRSTFREPVSSAAPAAACRSNATWR